MQDRFGRNINYLRISITDFCNNRCMYCMPPEGVEKKPHERILSFEDIENVVKASVSLGIDKFRITGGEPLVRRGVVGLIEKLSAIDGVKDLAVTTNGALLGKYAKKLKAAGLKRINISLDTFVPEKYAFITRGGKLEDVLNGITAAIEAGFLPIRINVVAMKGFNDDELLDFATLTLDKPIDVRFIELMPIGSEKTDLPYGFISVDEIKEKLGDLAPIYEKNSVASYYRWSGGVGRIGFISPMSNHFCGECNKIRLTADGKLKPCLHSDAEIDISAALVTGNVNVIRDAITEAINGKPEKHYLTEGGEPIKREMNRIGG